jgi:hypothetical protein
MKCVRLLAIIPLTVVLVACGGKPSNMASTLAATGAWTETLADASWQPLGSFSFDISLNENLLAGSRLNFSNMGSLAECFGAGSVMTGQLDQDVMSDSTMNLSISWTAHNGAGTNTITMQGAMAMGMGSGSGTFTLTGQTPGCRSQTGTFTINKRLPNQLQ